MRPSLGLTAGFRSIELIDDFNTHPIKRNEEARI
jgi:hypothetical protein